MVNNMDHGLPKFSLLGYDDWKIMMEAHLYALHDCMWMVLEDGPLKIQMENPERNPAAPDFKKMMKDFEEINLKHSSLTEENKLLSEENLKLTESRKSQLNEITQLKTENESLSEKVKSLNKELGILKSKEAVSKLLETTKHKGRKGLGFDPSCSKRKGKTTFIPLKPTVKPNKQKGKEKEKPTEVPKKEAAKYPGVWYLDSGCSRHMTGDASLLSNLIPYDGPRITFGGSNDFGLTKGLGNLVYKGLTIQVVSYVEGLNYNLLSTSQFCDKGYSLEFCKDMESLKNISTNEVILTRKRIRNIYEVIWNDVKEACLISKDKDEEVNEGDRMKPTEFIPFRSLPLKTTQRNPDSNSAEPSGNLGQPSNIPDLSNGDNSGNGDPVPIHLETPTTSVLQLEAELNQPINPNQHNLRWLRDHPPQQIIGDIQSGVRRRTHSNFSSSSSRESSDKILKNPNLLTQISEKMKIVGANIHFQKLEAKCSSPTFYQSYMEMIAAQELSEFLHMEIRFKYENEVLEFYKNGKVKTVKSKKDPQRTIQVINSTVGGTKVKLSQKKLGEKLHFPNSGVEIGRLPAKNLDWSIIGISGQNPSGPAKKTHLNKDYKLVLELVIACLECGSGGHADDITQERAFIINALITKSKVNWAAHFFNSISKHLGKPNQKYLCQGLYIGHILESLGAASEGKKYEARYWLYYLSSKGENRAGASTTAEESSSYNVLIMSLNKSVKRNQVVSPSPSAEAPQNLAPINLEEEEEFSYQGELQRKKKRKITSPSTSGHVNPDELKEKEPTEETSAHNWSSQQLEEEIPQSLERNYEDLHLEHLVTSPISEFEVDDEDPAVYKPVLSKTTEDQVVLTSEAHANLETTTKDFQIFLETSSALETVPPEAAVSTPQKQNQEGSNEEFQQLLHSEALEILTNPTETEIPEKSTENLEMSKTPETNEAQEEQAVEAQRSSAEAEKETQMAELEASKSPVAIFEGQNEAEERDSLSQDISNFTLGEAEEESERTLKINDEEDVQDDAESLPMQLFKRTLSSHQVTNFHFHSSSIPTLPDEVPEIWTKKVQGLIDSALASQHASFRQEIEHMEAKHNKLIEKSEETHCSNLKEISKSVDKTLEILSLLSNIVSNTMERYASDSYLQLKEANNIREQIANVTISLQKQMSILQMDIRAALAVSSANQVVTKDYLKVIIDNQKEAHKLFRLLTTNSRNRKMDVVLEQHSPSLILELPIAVKEGEVSYIPTHLNLTDLVLEAQRSNPENSTQRLSSSGLDGTEAVGTIAAHFSNENQTEERRKHARHQGDCRIFKAQEALKAFFIKSGG
ncbi:unnamed protein product, partial [Cuscuta campestris]